MANSLILALLGVAAGMQQRSGVQAQVQVKAKALTDIMTKALLHSHQASESKLNEERLDFLRDSTYNQMMSLNDPAEAAMGQSVVQNFNCIIGSQCIYETKKDLEEGKLS